ncbi:MAG TPA: hypothetical protein PKA58_17850 [Polyangium sp.]|nr:hypothetical protein [Polyangium sp.]
MRRIFVDGANAYENGDCVGVGRWVLGFGVAEKRSVRSLRKTRRQTSNVRKGMGTGERKTDPVHKPLKRPLFFVSLVE